MANAPIDWAKAYGDSAVLKGDPDAWRKLGLSNLDDTRTQYWNNQIATNGDPDWETAKSTYGKPNEGEAYEAYLARLKKDAENQKIASGYGGTFNNRVKTLYDYYAAGGDNSQLAPGQGQPGGGGAGGGAAETAQSIDKTRSIYETRNGEGLNDYGDRVLREGLAQFGPAYLNPNSAENPMANSPYAQWFFNRYRQQVGPNEMLAMTLNGGDPSQGFAEQMQARMQADLGDRNGQGFGGNLNRAKDQLGRLDALVNQIAGGHPDGLNALQRELGNRFLNEPRDVMTLLNAQLQGALGGGWGTEYIADKLGDMANDYYDDPVTNNPAQAGTFLHRALQTLGVR